VASGTRTVVATIVASVRAALSKFELRLTAVLTLIAFALRWPTFITRLFDPDEAAIGVQGMVVRSGGTLYRDIFDRKPPLPPLAYAASFSITDSTDIRPLRVLVTVFLAAAAVLVALEARRRWGDVAAWWAGVLLIAGAMAQFPADAGGANYAHFALLPGTAAVIWACRSRWGWAVGAGVALGLAVLSRQSWLLGAVPAGMAAYRAGRWRNIALVLGAAVLTVLATGFVAPLSGFWEWTVGNSPGFVFAPAGIGVSIVRGAASSVAFVGFHITAAVCLVVAFRRRNPLRKGGRDDLDLWLWLLVGLAAVAAGLRFFGHYWIQVLPPLVLLATPVAAELSGRLRRLAIAGVAVPAAVAFAMLFVPGSFHHRPNPTALADYVESLTSPSQRVFVWGSYPEVLVKADRLPAGDLVHTDFVTGRSGGRNDPAETLPDATPGALDIMMRSLAQHPPELVLDTSTASDLGYRAYPLSTIEVVDRFVRAGYHVVGVVDGVTVWQRNVPG
jgi:hypothetical protein